MAYERMAIAYFNRNEIGRAAEYGRKAYALRDKVSKRERLGIDSIYYIFVTGELEKGAENGELWQQTYPRDDQVYASLGMVFATL